MANLTRFTKSEELIGLWFDGTPDSAKEIVDWVKSIVGDQYQRGHMQRGKTEYFLGEPTYGRWLPEAILQISIGELPGTYHITIPAGAYIVYDPSELEVRFRVKDPVRLAGFTKVVMYGDISED